jgi:hypothetical protein
MWRRLWFCAVYCRTCKHASNAHPAFPRSCPLNASETVVPGPLILHRGSPHLRTAICAEEVFIKPDCALFLLHLILVNFQLPFTSGNMKRYVFVTVVLSVIAVAAKDSGPTLLEALLEGEICCMKVRPNSLRSSVTTAADIKGRPTFQLLNAQALENSTGMGSASRVPSIRALQNLWLKRTQW